MLFIHLGRRTRRVLLGGALTLTAALGLAGAASATPYYYLTNVHSGKVLMPENHSKEWGTTIVQETLGGWGAQTWFLEQAGTIAGGTPYYHLKNRHSKLCIHPSDWSGLNGTRLLQGNCIDSESATWQRVHWGNDTWNYYSRKTWDLMDIANSSTSAGATAVQNDYDGTASQRWRLVYAGDV